MANYFYNDARNTTTAGQVWLTLAAGDSITFGANTMWSSSNGSALRTSGNNRVTVLGQLYGEKAIVATGAFTTVTVGSGGVVAGNSHGIDASGASLILFNHGFISGATAIDGGRASQFENSGTISGGAYGFRMELYYTPTLTNSGTITATGTAMYLTGNQPVTITNTGSIRTNEFSFAIYVSNTSFGTTLDNSGLIAGSILVSGGASTVTNRGTIIGTVSLSVADDYFDTSLGYTSDTVYGGGGDDLLIGSTSRDIFNGGTGIDELRGNDGDDILAGGSGADSLNGGSGFDIASYGDAAVGVLADLASPGRNTGDAAGDIYIAIEGLQGSFQDDMLYGNDAANRLLGSNGNDLLDGRAGNDVMRGGFGNDSYHVDSIRDRVIEFDAQGIDTVITTISYTLPDFVENLTLAGTAAINGTGNALANTIIGNARANVIAGGAGNDTLHGGTGTDRFVFDTALNAATNVDFIDDFTVNEDKVQLSRSIFAALNGGATLRASAFTTGAAATDALDRIIYDPATGNLFYDADGNGAGAQVQFARLDIGLALTAADFVLTV